MDRPVDHFSRILPEQLPIGASYVVEGYGGETGNLRVISRYVLLPDGRRINVPADFALPAARRRAARGRNRLQRKAKTRPLATRKKFWRSVERPASRDVDCSAPGEAPQPLTLNHPVSEPRSH
jgi:hypothetical protein